MSWRDRLVPASFDGAPFLVLSASQKAGRKLHVQHFPGSRRVEVQDLSGNEVGGSALEITVNAYLIGDDYDFDRDVLEAALREGGVKSLTIPWRGTKRVTVISDIQTQESKGEGGYCTVSFTVIEDVPEEPYSRPARPAQVDAQATVVNDAAKADMVDKLDFSGLPSSNLTSGITALASATTAIEACSSRIAGAAGVAAWVYEPTSLASGVEVAAALIDAIGQSLGVANAGLEALEDAGASVREIARLTDIALAAAIDVMGFADALPVINTGTANGAQEAINRKSIVDTTRIVTVSEACRLTTTLTFESHSQAMSARVALVAGFDSVLEDLNDEVLADVLLLQANVIQHLDAVASALPDLRTYETTRITSAAEVAHDIYGDASRADEVAARNGIAAHLFIPAGTALELLSA